jgi:hypothetical protein
LGGGRIFSGSFKRFLEVIDSFTINFSLNLEAIGLSLEFSRLILEFIILIQEVANLILELRARNEIKYPTKNLYI